MKEHTIIEIAAASAAGRALRAAFADDDTRTVRIARDGDAGHVKVKRDEGIWSAPLDTRDEPLTRLAQELARKRRVAFELDHHQDDA